MGICSFVHLLVLLHLRCSTNSVDYYVKPSSAESKQCLPSGARAQQCKTLDEYAANSTEEFQEGDVRLLFLAGVHNLTMNLNFSQLHSVQMIPAFPGTQVKIHLLCGDRTIYMETIMTMRPAFTIKNLTIFGAKTSMIVLMDPQKVYVYGVNFYETSLFMRPRGFFLVNIAVQDSLIKQSSQTGLQIIGGDIWSLTLIVVNSDISHNQQGGIIVKSHAGDVHVNITNSTIEGINLLLAPEIWELLELAFILPKLILPI